MKEVFHVIGCCILGIALALGGIFALEALEITNYGWFAPKQAAVERHVFEQTKSYNQGVVQELRKAQLDFARAKDPTEKTAIASFALHQTADYDYNNLPSDLQSFVSVLQAQVTQ